MTNAFTQRELDILKLLADGKQTKHIARVLGISPFTVRDHLSTIFKKTGVSTRFELGLLAVRGGYGMVPSDPLKSLQDM